MVSVTVLGPDADLPYTDPGATVHLVTGSAGCREKHDGFIPNPPPWSVFRSSEYGYTIMKVFFSIHAKILALEIPKMFLDFFANTEKILHTYIIVWLN